MRFEKKYLFILLLPLPTLILGYMLFSSLDKKVKVAENLISNNKSVIGKVRFTKTKKSFVGTYGRKVIKHYVHYEFTDKNGKRKKSRAYFDEEKKSFRKNQSIEILVNPANTSINMPKYRAEDLSKESENYGFWMLLIIYSSIAPSCIFLLVKFLQNR